ncbi:MAG: hypothetical protein IJX51_06320 [Clostridia bacterium]|nr:hypothetical protein [Clostridia bacterium]
MKKINVFNMVIYTLFGVMLYLSDIIFEMIPNVHGVALLICVLSLVYRWKAIIPILIYVMITAITSLIVSAGYSLWWIPYIYIFPILWLLVTLIPKKANIKLKVALCIIFSGLHGLLFGLMYLPFQVMMYNLNFEMALAWLSAGLVFDIIHMVGNISLSTLIYPLYKTLTRLEKSRQSKFIKAKNE